MVIRKRVPGSMVALTALASLCAPAFGQAAWSMYGGNAQHTARALAPAQLYRRIRWSAPVDTEPPYSGNDLFIHYGSPLITPSNTVVLPVRTGAANTYRLDAFAGSTGHKIWSQNTDYQPPYTKDTSGAITWQFNWIPSVNGALASGRAYIPAAGGLLYYRNQPDQVAPTQQGHLCFYGMANYNVAPDTYKQHVFICTPITADSQGNIYFGYYVTGNTSSGGSTPLNLQSGFAKVAPNGAGSYVSATTAAGDAGIGMVTYNCAPALSLDEKTVYFTVGNDNNRGQTAGYLLRLDTRSLSTIGKVRLDDAANGGDANIDNNGTASPTVGPDGDVYMGVLELPWYSNHDRGWMLHFDRTLTVKKTPGAFGWDDTASIVPSSAVPLYKGTSKYLIMVKYNNYAGTGGQGLNKIAVLDPNATQKDPVTGATVMAEVLTLLGQTPDANNNQQFPGAVREWCINSAAVDPVGKCVIANSEDGVLYKWSLKTGGIIGRIRLTAGIGEAYTPTVVGPNGFVFAINNARLFCVSN